MKFLILLTLVFAASCASVPTQEPWGKNTVTYSFDNSFSGFDGITYEEAVNSFRKAAATWNAAGGVTLVEAVQGDIRITGADLSGRVLGRAHYPRNGGRVFMDKSDRVWTRRSFYAVALHEFGHAIGLGHSVCSTSIMYKKSGRVTRLSRYDVARIVTAYPKKEK